MSSMTTGADNVGPDRRTFLVGAGALLFTACAGSDAATDAAPTATATSVAGPEPTAVPPAATGTDAPGIPVLTAADFAAIGTCSLLPESTTGPYPSLADLDRSEIHEDYPGHPLRLGIRVVDEACVPVPDALVDIWHTDATGDYSSYEDNGSGKDEGEDSTFCRGVQFTNAEGIVEFTTIYPGWYEGRAVHIHISVRVDGEDVRTGQLYLDEAYTEAVYASGVYTEFGSPDTSWDDDAIAGDPVAEGSAMTVAAGETVIGAGTLGLINVGVAL